jgi:hypothetical protein
VKPLPNNAQRLAAFGATGTGKTAWVKQQIARMKPARLLVWDFKHDPGLDDMGKPFDDLGAMIRASTGARFQHRYRVDHGKDVQAQFELFCLLAWSVPGEVLMFVDELPEVTKANRAPPAWRRCVNVGREHRVGAVLARFSIIAAGQRPAECDKSFIGNCDVIHTGRLADAADATKMARSFGLKPFDLQNLPNLHWYEKRADTPGVQSGVLSFRKNAAKNAALGTKKTGPKAKLADVP